MVGAPNRLDNSGHSEKLLMARGAVTSSWNMRAVVMTSVVAVALTAILLFMYPKILQTLGLKAAPKTIAEDFEMAETEAYQDGEQNDEEEDDSEEEDEEGSEDDDEDDQEYTDDDDDVSIGTDSDFDTVADGSKEGFSLLKRAPPPAATVPSEGTSSKRLVVVHASWCGHCKTLLAPSGPWRKVKKALPGVTIVELDESENVDLVKALDIQSFPTIMILDSADKNATFYEGARTKDAIVDFALRNIQPQEI